MITRLVLDFDGDQEVIQNHEVMGCLIERDLSDITSLEALVDTREATLTMLGERCPNLEKFRLNNSIIPSIRDIGCTFIRLRYLWLPRCGISCLNGITTISRNLEELYLAFNAISDVSDLMGMEKLSVLDLEDNRIQDLSNIKFLTCCSGLKALTLSGNPCILGIRDYAREIAQMVPKLIYLDETRIRGRRISHSEASDDLSEPKVKEPEGRATLRFARKRPPEPDDVLITEFLDDQIRGRPPTSRGNYDISIPITSSPRKKNNDSLLRSLKSAAIFRPLATARRISVA
jgi:hypothetical protein